MTSRLAKETIEEMWAEGLKPSVEEIIYLNALGLKVENGPDSYNFAACPRCAFLGDTILWEPTVGKQIWIDSARQLVPNTGNNWVYLFAYALATPANELPQLTNLEELMKPIEKFTTDVLFNFTQTQIETAVVYAMFGADWKEPDEQFPATKEEKSVYDVPNGFYSSARQILNEALSRGMDGDSVKDVTMPTLERMVLVSLLANGGDILKNEQVHNAGKFYQARGKIMTKLREDKKIQEDSDGGQK